jgi:hypothetical protein
LLSLTVSLCCPGGSPDRQAESSSLTLRTGHSPPVVSHPASQRRSYLQIQAGERMPEEDSRLSDQIHSQSHWPDRSRSGAAGKRRYTFDAHGICQTVTAFSPHGKASCRCATRPNWPGHPARPHGRTIDTEIDSSRSRGPTGLPSVALPAQRSLIQQKAESQRRKACVCSCLSQVDGLRRREGNRVPLLACLQWISRFSESQEAEQAVPDKPASGSRRSRLRGENINTRAALRLRWFRSYGTGI